MTPVQAGAGIRGGAVGSGRHRVNRKRYLRALTLGTYYKYPKYQKIFPVMQVIDEATRWNV